MNRLEHFVSLWLGGNTTVEDAAETAGVSVAEAQWYLRQIGL